MIGVKRTLQEESAMKTCHVVSLRIVKSDNLMTVALTTVEGITKLGGASKAWYTKRALSSDLNHTIAALSLL